LNLTTEKGHKLNAWMIKPKDFDASKKYPVFMYQYSGPGSQEVANNWLDTNDLLVYVACTNGLHYRLCRWYEEQDLKELAFKKCTQKELGKYEVEDQIDAAKVIGNYPYVDKTRIGIWGWSLWRFYGDQTVSFKEHDVFKAGNCSSTCYKLAFL
jgi:dipeptidyl-peptidase-4